MAQKLTLEGATTALYAQWATADTRPPHFTTFGNNIGIIIKIYIKRWYNPMTLVCYAFVYAVKHRMAVVKCLLSFVGRR